MTEIAHRTDEGTPTQPSAGRRWWPDERPVTARGVVWEVAAGAVVACLGLVLLTGVFGGRDDDLGMLAIAIALSQIAGAGFSVSRPGPDRRHVLAYRAAWLSVHVFAIATATVFVLRFF